MTKKAPNDPAAVPPWGQNANLGGAPGGSGTFAQDVKIGTDSFVAESFGAGSGDPPPSVPIENPFGSVKASANPFKEVPLPPPIEEAPKERVIPENTPSWGEFANFVCKHGNQLIQAEYPLPRAEVVETMWAGIPVADGDEVRLRHKTAGWVSWEVATSE